MSKLYVLERLVWFGRKNKSPLLPVYRKELFKELKKVCKNHKPITFNEWLYKGAEI